VYSLKHFIYLLRSLLVHLNQFGCNKDCFAIFWHCFYGIYHCRCSSSKRQLHLHSFHFSCCRCCCCIALCNLLNEKCRFAAFQVAIHVQTSAYIYIYIYIYVRIVILIYACIFIHTRMHVLASFAAKAKLNFMQIFLARFESDRNRHI